MAVRFILGMVSRLTIGGDYFSTVGRLFEKRAAVSIVRSFHLMESNNNEKYP